MSTTPKPCPVCKGHHDHADLGLPGITFQLCKQVPPGFVWVDKQYPSGPNGAMLPLSQDTK